MTKNLEVAPILKRKFSNFDWWVNQVKYLPLAQKAFLLLNLSEKFPTNLNLEPTNSCNLNCSFCPTRKTNRPIGFIDLDLYEKLLDQTIERKRLQVLWLNKDGESLLHPDIDKLVSLAKKKKVAKRIEIYTNGLLLDSRMSEKLIKSGLDSLVVSLDANNSKDYFNLKGRDSYQRVVENISNFLAIRKNIRQRRPLLTVKMVDLNEKETEKFKDFWQNRADCVIIQGLHNWEGSIENQKSKSKNQKLGKRYPCNLPWLSPAICWDGKIMPCCVNFKDNELVMGDLKKQRLTEVWQSKKYNDLRKAHLNQDFAKFPTCQNCQFWQQLPNMRWFLKRKTREDVPKK